MRVERALVGAQPAFGIAGGEGAVGGLHHGPGVERDLEGGVLRLVAAHPEQALMDLGAQRLVRDRALAGAAVVVGGDARVAGHAVEVGELDQGMGLGKWPRRPALDAAQQPDRTA